METPYKLNHKCPFLTVDVAIVLPSNELVIIERKYPPLGFALVGGFVDYGESVEDAARREVMEEVGLELTYLEQVGVWSKPDRDKRAHIVTVAFLAKAEGHPKAGDDAKAVKIVPLGMTHDLPLIADHRHILSAALGKL